ncbi:MAG TPA: hypothetical protein VEY09_07185 [Pyrinomonadaceae bacterium]|nr:hypothetical protein [Pyrinomonadaceae bacterium]
MKQKARIKIIKRGERDRQQQHTTEAPEPKKGAQETARDMVATVSQWVSEFQQKRRQETAQAFKTLFADPAPQTGKA